MRESVTGELGDDTIQLAIYSVGRLYLNVFQVSKKN
jgi:hypothetical protein